jgi:hypothetical protein
MKKLVLVYGSIAGSVVALMLIISFVILIGNSPDPADHDMTWGMVIGFTAQFLAMSFIFIATHSYKKNVLGGTIRFWPAFKIGLLISLVASTIYVITWVILYHTGSSAVMETMAQQEIAAAKPADVEDVKARWAFYRTLPGLILWTYLEILPTGILFSLISALIFWLSSRKKKKESNTVTQP